MPQNYFFLNPQDIKIIELSENTGQIITGNKKDPNIEPFTHSASSTEAVSAVKANFRPTDYHLNANTSQKMLSVGKNTVCCWGTIRRQS